LQASSAEDVQEYFRDMATAEYLEHTVVTTICRCGRMIIGSEV